MTENFFESAEPTFDELTPEEFFLRFPEGPYKISGRATDGRKLESIDEFTHLMPAPPENIDGAGRGTERIHEADREQCAARRRQPRSTPESGSAAPRPEAPFIVPSHFATRRDPIGYRARRRLAAASPMTPTPRPIAIPGSGSQSCKGASKLGCCRVPLGRRRDGCTERIE